MREFIIKKEIGKDIGWIKQLLDRSIVYLNSLPHKRYIFNFHYLRMSVVPQTRGKMVSNFIIIPAPTCQLPTDTTPSSTTKRQDSVHSEEQRLSVKKTEEPTIIPLINKKRYPKDDYQKNITINVVKCCIREIISTKYRRLLQKKCACNGITLQSLISMVSPVLKEVVISLGDLKKLLSKGADQNFKLKRVFSWFLEWYLRKRYMYYLLKEGKMDHKERYIDYKNKYMLYLIQANEQKSSTPFENSKQKESQENNQ